jgi:beta-carotene hydroxylase
MRPRFDADYRTLFWAFVLFPLVPAAGLVWPSSIPWLLPVELYLAYCAGIVAHNQVHVPVFSSRQLNAGYAAWLSIFYGCPIAFWVPTHLENHHRFSNGEADVTRTDRHSARHDAWQALRYTFACGAWQLPLIGGYVRAARARNGRSWHELWLQIGVVAFGHALPLAFAVSAYGLGRGALFYLGTFGLPALCAPGFMLFTNYAQHVHCDAASPDNHCRNFVGPIANWLTFQAGYHTVHHERPAVHWSRYPELHAARAGALDPTLNVSSILGFCVDNYLLRPFGLRAGTQPLARGAQPQ